MKKFTLILFVFSQFVFAQSGEDINTIYIDCDGDSIAVNVSQFPNLAPEMLFEMFEMFDCSDADEWFWGEDSSDVNNPWEDEDDDFWDFDSTDVNNPWDEEELAFDCINSSPEAFELYLSCMNGDEGACGSLEMLCGGEEEEGEEEEGWADDIDAIIEQLENDCASEVDFGWSCGMLEMIYSCMNGSEDTCQYLEEIFEDFDFEEGDEEEDEEEFDCINSSPEAFELYLSCMNGDEGACGSLEMLCGGEEEEWSWGEGENMGALFDAIFSITVTENELVLVLEANDLVVSVFDESGFEFLPSLVDNYLVFGPFDTNELYDVIIENMDGLEVLWGLFKPMSSDLELIEEGIVSATDNNFGDMFYLNQIISINEVHQDLKVYNTQYYDLMGRKVSNPSKDLYIEVQTTNIGEISTKRFIFK